MEFNMQKKSLKNFCMLKLERISILLPDELLLHPLRKGLLNSLTAFKRSSKPFWLAILFSI